MRQFMKVASRSSKQKEASSVLRPVSSAGPAWWGLPPAAAVAALRGPAAAVVAGRLPGATAGERGAAPVAGPAAAAAAAA